MRYCTACHYTYWFILTNGSVSAKFSVRLVVPASPSKDLVAPRTRHPHFPEAARCAHTRRYWSRECRKDRPRPPPRPRRRTWQRLAVYCEGSARSGDRLGSIFGQAVPVHRRCSGFRCNLVEDHLHKIALCASLLVMYRADAAHDIRLLGRRQTFARRNRLTMLGRAS